MLKVFNSIQFKLKWYDLFTNERSSQFGSQIIPVTPQLAFDIATRSTQLKHILTTLNYFNNMFQFNHLLFDAPPKLSNLEVN